MLCCAPLFAPSKVATLPFLIGKENPIFLVRGVYNIFTYWTLEFKIGNCYLHLEMGALGEHGSTQGYRGVSTERRGGMREPKGVARDQRVLARRGAAGWEPDLAGLLTWLQLLMLFIIANILLSSVWKGWKPLRWPPLSAIHTQQSGSWPPKIEKKRLESKAVRHQRPAQNTGSSFFFMGF